MNGFKMINFSQNQNQQQQQWNTITSIRLPSLFLFLLFLVIFQCQFQLTVGILDNEKQEQNQGVFLLEQLSDNDMNIDDIDQIIPDQQNLSPELDNNDNNVEEFSSSSFDKTSSSPKPVVLWHGLGDSYDSSGMQRVAITLRRAHPGTFVYSVRLNNDSSSDSQASFVGKVNDQVSVKKPFFFSFFFR